MCGIVGVLSHSRVNQCIYDALTIVQHRGQDAAGILTSDQNNVYLRKSHGLVRNAIRQKHMMTLKGNLGIGHVRYPTAGTDSDLEAQPFYVNSPYGLGLVHNGNLVNTKILADELSRVDLRHLNTRSDSEVLLNIIAYELQKLCEYVLTSEALFLAMSRVYKRVQGGFSGVMLIHGYGLVAFRDPHGIRPLVYGRKKHGSGYEYMAVSETVALDVLGFEYCGDVQPGEVIFFDLKGGVHRHVCAEKVSHTPCIFEYIYLSRQDSVIDGISVYQARLNMGERLADAIMKHYSHFDIDVVIPVPDTSRTSAWSLAQSLGVMYSEGFVKNRYIGRTFIMPDQKERKSNVRLKLNAIKQEFEGKSVLLVDDSIVRGTTSREIVQMARDVGAKRVYLASAAPEVRYPNVYGIDMPNAIELVAHDRTTDQIAEFIQADGLIYQALEDVEAAINDASKNKNASNIQFEGSIFTGVYIAGKVDQGYLEQLAKARSDGAKKITRDKVI